MRTSVKTVYVGDVAFVVEYDYMPAEAPIYDVDSPVCGPGCDEDVDLISIKCEGSDFELLDLLAPKVDALIKESILVELSA